MDSLFQKMERLLVQTSVAMVRDLMHRIHWNQRLISVRGARGVGKTTMLLQYIKLNYPQRNGEVLYCTLDSLYFSRHSILELVEDFYIHGGRHLFLDEVHKYPGWSREIKEAYDMYPSLRIVITGSSLLNIINADADLSRRCLPYHMYGLSFREFLKFYKGIDVSPCSLEDIAAGSSEVVNEVNAQCSPMAMLDEYLRQGYYPFFDGNREDYYIRLENVVNFILDQELPLMEGVLPSYSRKLKALMSTLASSTPFEVDVSKLSRLLEIGRDTVLNYLHMLGKADMLSLLYSDLQSVKRMQKPDKIYMANANLLYALNPGNVDKGTLRETFVVSQLNPGHEVEYGKEAGDFVVDGRWRFEVGGARKGFRQIADIPDSFVLADNIEYAVGNKLPLWLIGFLS